LELHALAGRREPAPEERSEAMSTRPPSSLDLEPETMRRLGYVVVERIIEHLTGMDAEPAWRMMTREEGESALREPLPREGRPVDELLPVLFRDVLDNAGHVSRGSRRPPCRRL
jgi:hypothetical protein